MTASPGPAAIGATVGEPVVAGAAPAVPVVPALPSVSAPSDDAGRSGSARSTQAVAAQRAEVLVEALPYIQRFRGAIVVVKYGGNAMVDPALARAVADDVVLLRAVGLRPVVVHGGGPQITELMARLGKESEFRHGLRVTDAETVDIARMVLVGKVNRDIVAAINVHGPIAVGLSGEDAGLILASAHNPELGFVGDVAAVNPGILHKLLAEDLIPVVSTIGADTQGQAYNINADTVAGALAEALQAEKAVFLTDVAGLLTDVDDPTSLVSRLTASELAAMIDGGVLTGGMIPKTAAALHAVRHGVGSAHLLDGRQPHVVLLELFSDAGIGTMITPDPTPPPATGDGTGAAVAPAVTPTSATGDGAGAAVASTAGPVRGAGDGAGAAGPPCGGGRDVAAGSGGRVGRPAAGGTADAAGGAGTAASAAAPADGPGGSA